MVKVAGAKIGRPSGYSEELAVEILSRIQAGESLRSICTDSHMPGHASVYRWIGQDSLFRDAYLRAREDSAEMWAGRGLDLLYEVPDGASASAVNLAIIRSKYCWWLAQKYNPGRFGQVREKKKFAAGALIGSVQGK